jgi:hypothetical protein
MARAERFAVEAAGQLAGIPAGPCSDALRQVTRFVVERHD